MGLEDIGIQSNLAKTVFALLIMLGVAAGLLTHPALRNNTYAVYGIAFVEVFLMLLFWKIGLIPSSVVLIVTIMAIVIFTLLIGSQVMG